MRSEKKETKFEIHFGSGKNISTYSLQAPNFNEREAWVNAIAKMVEFSQKSN
jgi:hypothetical protein